MTQGIETSSGVQALIAKIREEGVTAGKAEADALVADAKAQAQKLVMDARREAEQLRKDARRDIEAQNAAAMEALRIAERDTILDLRSRIVATFDRHLRRLVTDVTREPEFIRTMVLTLAGQVQQEHVRDKRVDLVVSEQWAGEQDHVKNLVLGISREMLRDGVELRPAGSFTGGVRVRLHEEDIEIDLSDDAVSELLLAQLLPRYRAILDGVE